MEECMRFISLNGYLLQLSASITSRGRDALRHCSPFTPLHFPCLQWAPALPRALVRCVEQCRHIQNTSQLCCTSSALCALGSNVCCLLVLYSTSSSSSRTSLMGLVSSQFYIGIKSVFYTFQCSMMCVQLCFPFRGVCSQPPLPWILGTCLPQPLFMVVNDFPEGAC